MKAKAKQPEPSNWYKDRYQTLLIQRKLLVWITFASLICTLLSVVTIVQMIPQKTIAPYVIQVDQKSGITQVVDPIKSQELTGNAAINNYFITQYIRARENYSAQDILRTFETVRLMSEPRQVFAAYRQEVDGNNRDSVPTRLGAVGTRTVKFKSISELAPRRIQARVLIEEKSDGVNVSAQYHRIITLTYEYTKLSLSQEERSINPLGFRVTEYNVVEETL